MVKIHIKPVAIIISVICTLLIGGGVIAYILLTQSDSRLNQFLTKDDENKSVSLVQSDALDALAKKSAAEPPIDMSHLSDSITPPTNKWFSGFALQADPKPGFFYPGSFRPTNSGFEIGMPNVNVGPDSIIAPHAADLVVTFQGADAYTVSYYDEVVVGLTYYQDGVEIADVRVGSGLPYIFITSSSDQLKISYSGTAEQRENSSLIRSNGKVFGLNKIATDADAVQLSKDSSASFFVLADETDFDELLQAADATVTTAQIDYEVNEQTTSTTITYQTVGDKPTIYAALPHQTLNDVESFESSVSYQSILGELKAYQGNSFTFSAPYLPITEELMIRDLPTEKKDLLRQQLASDIRDTPLAPEDTYFGGKYLQRLAMLVSIADQLGEDDLRDEVLSDLKDELEQWFTAGRTAPKSFQYDSDLQSIVGTVASFGSDNQLNDHHFHYGYFMTAAAMLSKYDKEFLQTYRQQVDLLAADVANYRTDEALPLRRNFDPYVSHSWASGIAPFNDGNNQESTSEAFNAWSGAALWGRVSGNAALEKQASWMYSQEYAAAQRYWLLRGNGARATGYSAPIVSLVWGAKHEYRTFFSDDANAKLAIQLLPLTPTLHQAGYEVSDAERSGTGIERQYGDAILMATPNATIEQAQALPDSAIDDGNSRTYMYAYILSK